MHAAGQRWLGRSTVVTMLAALLAIAAVLPWASPASAQAWPALAGGSSTAPSTTDPCSTGAPGLGFWNGQVCIGTTRLPDGSFQMTDPARAGLSCGAAVNSTVIDPETGEEAPIHALGPRFAQQGNAWGNGQPADATTACVDAMYAGSEEWDMLGTWLGRNGINGEGQATGIGVGARHADGSPYFNAFFLQALPQFGLNEPVVILGFLPALPTNPELPVPASTQPDPMGRQFTSMVRRRARVRSHGLPYHARRLHQYC